MSYKWERREQRRKAKRNIIPKHGRSLFTIEEITRKKAEKIKSEKIKKKRQLEDKTGE